MPFDICKFRFSENDIDKSQFLKKQKNKNASLPIGSIQNAESTVDGADDSHPDPTSKQFVPSNGKAVHNVFPEISQAAMENDELDDVLEEAIRAVLCDNAVSHVIASFKQAGYYEVASELLRRGDREKALAVLRKYLPQSQRVPFQAAHKKLSEKRTRFFVKYAKPHGVRMSALFFLITVLTRTEYWKGRRGRDCAFNRTASWFGAQIGVSKYQIFKMLRQARREKMLDFEKTRRGMRIWVRNRDFYVQYGRGSKGNGSELVFGFYDLRLARILGLNGAIVYDFLKKAVGDWDKHRSFGVSGITTRFPWMNPNTARCVLEDLYHRRVISRKHSQFHSDRGFSSWLYFWKARGKAERLGLKGSK